MAHPIDKHEHVAVCHTDDKQSGPSNMTDAHADINQPSTSSSNTSAEVVGYLHNISPLKKGRYFDFQMQTKEKTVRGVCFSPPKLKRFCELSQKSSPVKLKKFRVDTASNSEDLLMGRDVIIEDLQEIDFQKQELPTTMNVSNATTVCPGQEITLKAKVAHIYPAKTVGKDNVMMQNAVVMDPTGTIKLTLWENYTNTVNQGSTYIFKNLSVRNDKFTSELYLNTLNSSTTIESAPEFQEILPVTVLESQTVDVEIIGVQKVQSYTACFKCNKRVDNSRHQSIIQCSSCHFKQKQNLAPKHWFVQLLVEVKNSSATKLTLTLFENTIHQIAKINGHPVEINQFTAELIEEIIFDTSVISVTYNKKSHIVENVNAVLT